MNRRHTTLIALAVLAPLFGFLGCARRPAVTLATVPTPTGSSSSGVGGEAASEGAARPGAPAGPTIKGPSPSEFTPTKRLADIHFDFDGAAIRPSDRKVLDDNAIWMKTNGKTLILIEGHADERGTDEYNLALAERRAETTRNYLVAQGVASARII
jgi:peptidoglycan-associated lipoprotein